MVHARVVPSMTQRPFVFRMQRSLLYGKLLIFHLVAVKMNLLHSISMITFTWISIKNKTIISTEMENKKREAL